MNTEKKKIQKQVKEEKRKQGEALLPLVSDKALQKEIRRRGKKHDMQASDNPIF